MMAMMMMTVIKVIRDWWRGYAKSTWGEDVEQQQTLRRRSVSEKFFKICERESRSICTHDREASAHQATTCRFV